MEGPMGRQDLTVIIMGTTMAEPATDLDIIILAVLDIPEQPRSHILIMGMVYIQAQVINIHMRQ